MNANKVVIKNTKKTPRTFRNGSASVIKLVQGFNEITPGQLERLKTHESFNQLVDNHILIILDNEESANKTVKRSTAKAKINTEKVVDV
jgi:hypothetical protein